MTNKLPVQAHLISQLHKQASDTRAAWLAVSSTIASTRPANQQATQSYAISSITSFRLPVQSHLSTLQAPRSALNNIPLDQIDLFRIKTAPEDHSTPAHRHKYPALPKALPVKAPARDITRRYQGLYLAAIKSTPCKSSPKN